MWGVLSRREIEELMKRDPPIVEGAKEEQIQPNGVDLTISKVFRFTGHGKIGIDNRTLAQYEEVEFRNGWVKLEAGAYKIVFNEIVNIPLDLMGMAMPRSTLLRCGATVLNAVWDAGYRGRSEALLVVFNEKGIEIEKGARVDEIVFIRLTSKLEQGYSGIYQFENI